MLNCVVSIGRGALVGGEDAAEGLPAFDVALTEPSERSDGAWGVLVKPHSPDFANSLVYCDPRASWYFSGGGVACGIWLAGSEVRVFANSLMAFLHRTIGGILDGDFNATLSVSIVTALGHTTSFTTQMTVGLHFPGDLRYAFAEHTVNDFTSPHEPSFEPSEEVGPAGDYIGFSDEIAGDVATEAGASVLTAPADLDDTRTFLPRQKIPPERLRSLASVTLARPESGVTKMRWLSDFLALHVPAGSPVLVGGDHPGTLSRRLVDMGFSVRGVDPLNKPVSVPRSDLLGAGTYIQERDTISVGTLEDSYGVDWGGAVFDIAVARDSAEADTAVNLGACRLMYDKGVPFTIGKARSVPRVPGEYWLLDNVGWEVRGCETYLSPCRRESAWPDGARARLHVTEGDDYVRAHWPGIEDLDEEGGKRRPWWVPYYFEADDAYGPGWFRIPNDHWYHFVTMRANDHALRRDGHGLAAQVRGCRSAVDVWLALRTAFRGLDPSVRAEVAGRFRTDDPVGARGVPRSMMEKFPGLPAAMAGRYEGLLALCQDPQRRCPQTLGLLMKHPGAGALLSDLSQLRGLMGDEDVAIANYSRVLPLGAMGILGSEVFTRLVYWLALMTARVYKPWHAWELQHRLWALSSFGTDEERYIYFFDQFERVFSAVDQARGAGRKAHVMERCMRRFDDNLATLNMRDDYLDHDHPYALMIARRTRPFQHRAARTVPVAYSETVATSAPAAPSIAAVPPGGSPIRDLADFGRRAGWGPRTTLHVILGVTAGRADPARVYAYWCSLSPIVRPRSIPRAAWAPRLQLNTDSALKFRLPGVDSPEALVRVRDEQLKDLTQ